MKPQHPINLPPAFTSAEVDAAADAWRFNCGPGALCAVLGYTPEGIRPHLDDFEKKGYTNPTLMLRILRGLKVGFQQRIVAAPNPAWCNYGLARIQWAGPWTEAGVPQAARYRHTHWVAVRRGLEAGMREIFDINAVYPGSEQSIKCDGWVSYRVWTTGLVPWLLKHLQPKATGEAAAPGTSGGRSMGENAWWPTHFIDLQ